MYKMISASSAVAIEAVIEAKILVQCRSSNELILLGPAQMDKKIFNTSVSKMFDIISYSALGKISQNII